MKSLNPMYMFGSLGKDPMPKQKISTMIPFKQVAVRWTTEESLEEWTRSPNKNYNDLQELYGVYRHYDEHVHSMVEG